MIRESNVLAMRPPIESTGFAPPAGRPLGGERRSAAVSGLFATLALAIGTVVAATAITAGMAEADIADPAAGQQTGLVAAAVAIAGLVTGTAGLAALKASTDRDS